MAFSVEAGFDDANPRSFEVSVAYEVSIVSDDEEGEMFNHRTGTSVGEGEARHDKHLPNTASNPQEGP
jgi:hypothetical protein